MSRFEANVKAQPALARAALAAPAPAWLKAPKGGTTWFVGVGTNHHAARIASWLWNSAGLKARARHGFDYVAARTRPAKGDLAVFLSHRGGSKSYTVMAEASARRAGIATVAVCGQGAVWKGPKRRLETCALEDTGAYTKSFTTTMAWLLRWAGKPALLKPFKDLDASLAWGPEFPHVPRHADLVFLGDGLREWVAKEAALKLLEAAHLKVRAYGLEEFLHGPHISVGEGTVVVGFATPGERRWDAARAYLETIGVPFTKVESSDWLRQVVWAQRLTVSACRALGLSPDLLRSDDERYARAKSQLAL